MTKHPAEIKLRPKGPESTCNDAIKVLRDMGFVDLSNSGASWKDSFPTLRENETGTYLAGARHREGLTQRQLAEKSGLPQRHISEMENAKKLAVALNTDYRVFL